MCSLFAHHGLPEQMFPDNDLQYTSQDYGEFMKGNQIQHILTTPYHPALNGLAERFVQTLKCALKASLIDDKTLQHYLADFLFATA